MIKFVLKKVDEIQFTSDESGNVPLNSKVEPTLSVFSLQHIISNCDTQVK